MSSTWPRGTVAFLYTDIEGSTKLWQAHPDVMPAVVSRHDRILREAVERHGGVVFRTVGDGCCAAFSQAHDAVTAAVESQRTIQSTAWEEDIELRVRMAVHAGPVQILDGEYTGHTMNRVARLLSAAHGGQILLSATAQALVQDHLPREADVLDLGEHRLKDLERPEHIYQIVSPDLPADPRGVISIEARPSNLPRDRTLFVGRERDIAAVSEMLRRSDVQLLTLTGPGGTGKTRLSVRVARELADEFRDGVFFVQLAPVGESRHVAGVIAAVLGVEDVSDQPLPATLQAYLMHRKVLLVLDNFEHLLDAAPVVADLLSAPGLKILVTSRSALRVSGEREYAVPPLAVPDPRHLPELGELSQYDAVALFIQRAQAVKADFAVTNENAPAVAEICHRLDGLPLAIELAAARVRLFPPQALLSRLQNRLQLLTGGARDLPTRQQTLRGAIDWSYSLLDRGEQQLFARVSVFAGGFTLEAAEMVCNRDGDLAVDILDGVESLVEKSLLRQEGEDEPRFVMLETINEYAGERLNEMEGDPSVTAAAHASYFAGFARNLWDQLSSGNRTALASRLTDDVENLRLAWRFWVRKSDLDQLNRLIDSLWLVYDSQGWYRTAIDLMTEMLGILSSAPPSPERRTQEITLRTTRARIMMAFQGYTQDVEDAFTEAAAAAGDGDELPQLFPVLRGLSSFYTYRGEFQKAAEVGRAILRLAEIQGDTGMRAEGHLVLGEALSIQDQPGAGLEHFDTALRLFGEQNRLPGRFRVGNHPEVAALGTSALTLWLVGFPDQALERLNRAVDLAATLEHPSTRAYALFHTALIHSWRREPGQMRARAAEALAVAQEHDLQIWRALGTFFTGAADTELGRVREGLEGMRSGLALYQGLKTPPVFWPMLLFIRAGVALGTGTIGEGLQMIDEAIQIVGTEPLLGPLLSIMKGDLLLARSPEDASQAEEWYQRSYERARDLSLRMLQLRAAVGLYRSSSSADSAEVARKMVASVYATFTEGFDTADLLAAAALVEGAPGNTGAAREAGA